MEPTHNVLVIDLEPVEVNEFAEAIRSIKMPTTQELQALEDCENYLIIDPLQNTYYKDGTWVPIPTAKIEQNDSIITVR